MQYQLKKINYLADSNVILDKCPACQGIWADGGEAKAIAEHLKVNPKIEEFAAALAESQISAQEQLLGRADDFDMDIDADTVLKCIKAGIFFPRIIIPLSDDAQRQRFPLVTLTIISLTVATSLASGLLQNTFDLAEVFRFLDSDSWAVNLVSSMVVSCGTLGLAWNMLFLWLFGDNVEDRFGRAGFGFFYLAIGLCSAALYAQFENKTSLGAVGVSGAVSAVMGAYFVFYPTAMVKVFAIFRMFEVPSVVLLGIWFMFQLIYPMITADVKLADTPVIANIIGFIFGALIAAMKKSSNN